MQLKCPAEREKTNKKTSSCASRWEKYMTFDLPKKPIYLNFRLANIPTHFGKKKKPKHKKPYRYGKTWSVFFQMHKWGKKAEHRKYCEGGILFTHYETSTAPVVKDSYQNFRCLVKWNKLFQLVCTFYFYLLYYDHFPNRSVMMWLRNMTTKSAPEPFLFTSRLGKEWLFFCVDVCVCTHTILAFTIYILEWIQNQITYLNSCS